MAKKKPSIREKFIALSKKDYDKAIELEFWDQIGISKRTFYRDFQGLTVTVPAERYEAYAKFLGCKPDEFEGYEAKPPVKPLSKQLVTSK